MTLRPGTRLGPYEITGLLGLGGMGEVYRATDTKLKRDVAIKVLPQAFTQDTERLARFEREAQVLAQLHHPHIASIFGLEDSGGVRALVMELVEGPTLADRLTGGPLPLDECLSVARQIAEALEEAHEKGIVHRDLKPQNVKAPVDGTVKVLDFGLAKAMDSSSGSTGSDPSRSPTLMNSPTMTSVQGTQLGVILGTAAYMAPEQARGGAIDRRADIWAFGVVLYEMLCGRSLFGADTVSDTLAGVLKTEIDFSKLPPATPQPVRRLLRSCLERNPRNRLRDIGDARLALDAAAVPEQDASAAPARPVRSRWLLGAIALALFGGIAAGRLLRSPAPVRPDVARWALAVPDGLTLSTLEQTQIAISRDGKLMVAVAVDAKTTQQLLLRSQSEFEPRLLPDTERATSPFFSPDGAWIAFFRDNAVFKIPVAGGPPLRLAVGVGQPRGGTWSRDGYLYIAPDASAPLRRVSQDGGELAAVTQLDVKRDERTHRWPAALPDGSAVLFTCDDVSSTEYYDDARIEALRPATGERKVVLEGASMARYAAGGHLVFARGGGLYAVRFDPKSLTTSGSPFLVAPGIATDVSTGAVDFDVAEDGSAAWIPGSPNLAFSELWVDREGRETPVAIPVAPYNELALSPDGKRVALAGGQGGIADLWVYDLERGSMTRLTVNKAVSRPVWSRDGVHVAYGVRVQGVKSKDNVWQIAWRAADGSRDEEVLLERERAQIPSDFTPDGRMLVYDAFDTSAQYRNICLLPLGGARQPSVLIGGSFSKYDAVVSPDGRWIAYVSTEGGQPSVFVRPFPAGEGRWQISTPTGTEPRWSASGRELFYRAGNVLQVVAIDTSHGFVAGRPERVFDRVATGAIISSYGVSPDGKRIFTFRLSEGQGTQRQVYLDRGFERRLSGATTR